MSDVCSSCPHAVADHEATGCITCQCGAVYAPADPEPAPESSTVVPETEDETGIVVPEPAEDEADAESE